MTEKELEAQKLRKSCKITQKIARCVFPLHFSLTDEITKGEEGAIINTSENSFLEGK